MMSFEAGKRVLGICSVSAVVAASALFLLSGANWAFGEDHNEESGKDPSAIWDEQGRRREDPPTPTVTVVDDSADGADALRTRAAAMGFDSRAVDLLINAMQNGDAVAIAELLTYSDSKCGTGDRSVAAPCPQGEETNISIVRIFHSIDTFWVSRSIAEQALRAVLNNNPARVALVGETKGGLFVAFELGSKRDLPAGLPLPTHAIFVQVMLNPTSNALITSISMGETNPLSMFRWLAPDLSGLAFVGQTLLRMEKEDEQRITQAKPGPIPPVSR